MKNNPQKKQNKSLNKLNARTAFKNEIKYNLNIKYKLSFQI